ncbi:hypothetical protein HFK83_03305 [Ralstonia pseudosolanacearum]|uniref:hypothetical protein n=1 Tax=Ralstonia solanacearum species complex TaxID=3116862 RepID=UPI0020061B62|nr:hypothetical protein [Ralstonia pseudosolanacearum]MCK4121397.1 hypothetical protein [Ralstonia pseudosolanacearum]
MQRVQHPTNNSVLGAPEGWDQSVLPVGAMPITRTEVNGVPAVASYWKPSADELAQLNAGGSVALWVLGPTMPPVAVEVEP